MGNLSRDEEIINKIVATGAFSQHNANLSDDALIVQLVSLLEPLYTSQTIILTITGGPGGGKSTLRERLIQKLEADGHPTDYVSTDDFGLYTREERNRLIHEGKINPWTAKDWVLLNRLVDEVRGGKSVKAPVYDEATGDAAVVGEENFPHIIPPNLHFLIVEGDFQPVEHADKKIYFHVPTDVRRENRVVRDIAKRSATDIEGIKKSFDFRLESQYYPYTIPNAEKADILILTDTKPSTNLEYPFVYTYSLYTKN